jgi:hypothetical protein
MFCVLWYSSVFCYFPHVELCISWMLSCLYMLQSPVHVCVSNITGTQNCALPRKLGFVLRK